MTSPDPEEYVELVLSVVEEIPWGRVTSYGAIAGVVGGGPRQVGAVMSRHGGPVPWWRVVRADGSLPPSHEENARPHYLDEGTPLRPSGAVDMAAAFWEPEPPAPLSAGGRLTVLHRSGENLCTELWTIRASWWRNRALRWMTLWNQKNVRRTSCADGSGGHRTSLAPPLRWRRKKGPNNSYLFGPFAFPGVRSASHPCDGRFGLTSQ